MVTYDIKDYLEDLDNGFVVIDTDLTALGLEVEQNYGQHKDKKIEILSAIEDLRGKINVLVVNELHELRQVIERFQDND